MSSAHEEKFKFFVDNKEYEWSKPTITGAEIRVVAGIAPTYQLFLEAHGEKKEDRQIRNDDIVNLKEHGVEKLFSVPPATFGRPWV